MPRKKNVHGRVDQPPNKIYPTFYDVVDKYINIYIISLYYKAQRTEQDIITFSNWLTIQLINFF